MAKQTARGWDFEIRDADGSTWLPITQINEWDEDRGENNEITESTDFASEGEYEGRKMQVGASLTLTGTGDYNSSGVQAAGQTRVEFMHRQFAEASVARLRFKHESQVVWTVWDCVVQLGSRGGGNNDWNSWEATFTRTGAATTM